MKCKYLILGASSSLGKEFKKNLLEIKNICIESVENRLSDIEIKNKIIEFRPDYIINCIGVVDKSFKICLEINTLIPKLILDILYKENLKTRTLFIGSAAEYGVVESDENPVAELHPCAPISNYGLSKYWQSILVEKYSELGVNGVVGRIFNLESEDLSNKLFLGSLSQQIKKFNSGEISEIKVGNLNDYRDYISTEEAVKKLLNVLKYGTSGEVYNIGSGQAIKMTELLNKYISKYKIDSANIKEDKFINESKVKIIYSNNKKYNELIKNNYI